MPIYIHRNVTIRANGFASKNCFVGFHLPYINISWPFEMAGVPMLDTVLVVPSRVAHCQYWVFNPNL